MSSSAGGGSSASSTLLGEGGGGGGGEVRIGGEGTSRPPSSSFWPISCTKHDSRSDVAARQISYMPKSGSGKVKIGWPANKFLDSPMREWGVLLKPVDSRKEGEGPIFFRCLANSKCHKNEVCNDFPYHGMWLYSFWLMILCVFSLQYLMCRELFGILGLA